MNEIYRYTIRLSDNLGDKFIFDTNKYQVDICNENIGVIAVNMKSGEKTIIPWTTIKYLTKKAIAGRYPWPEDEADKQRAYDYAMGKDIDPIAKARAKSDNPIAPENWEDHKNA